MVFVLSFGLISRIKVNLIVLIAFYSLEYSCVFFKVDMKRNFSIFFYLRFYKFGLFWLVWNIFYCDICCASCPKISSKRRSTHDFQLRV